MKNQLRAPAQFVRDWSKGYFTVALSSRRLVHFTPQEPYALPICGASKGGTYEVGIYNEYSYDVCGKCIQLAMQARMYTLRPASPPLGKP